MMFAMGAAVSRLSVVVWGTTRRAVNSGTAPERRAEMGPFPAARSSIGRAVQRHRRASRRAFLIRDPGRRAIRYIENRLLSRSARLYPDGSHPGVYSDQHVSLLILDPETIV